MQRHTLATLCTCLLLAACGADKPAATGQQAADDGLPMPDGTAGSVTDMPNPGKPAVLPPPADDIATDNEDPSKADEEASQVDHNVPAEPPAVTLDGALGKPPPDTMPVMPANPPLPEESSQATPPPEP